MSNATKPHDWRSRVATGLRTALHAVGRAATRVRLGSARALSRVPRWLRRSVAILAVALVGA
ncbi:MAG: hypothetical protein ACRDQZ_07670, partial [Mycobacteriales bacterium]